MAYGDLTRDFHTLVQDKKRNKPDSQRARISRNGHTTRQNDLGKEFVAEAYNILNHVTTLKKMLANIRKPYLNVDSRHGVLSRQGSRNADFGDSGQLWAGIRHLTNAERDQIDIQARLILTRCAERVKEMEALEKRRADLVASQVNPLTRLLPARLRQDARSFSSDVIAAHHSSITWYLSRRLTEASQNQKEMQEERVKRQGERTRTLGSSVGRETVEIGPSVPQKKAEQRKTKGVGWLGAPSNFIAATIGVPSYEGSRETAPPTKRIDHPPLSYDDDDDDDDGLTPSQIMQFEMENADLLKSVQDTLESVQLAESRLTEISTLQMELVTHLTHQTELTDQLYEDAIAATSTVEKGNAQLREAKRRAKDSRKWILVFLIGRYNPTFQCESMLSMLGRLGRSSLVFSSLQSGWHSVIINRSFAFLPLAVT